MNNVMMFYLIMTQQNINLKMIKILQEKKNYNCRRKLDYNITIQKNRLWLY